MRAHIIARAEEQRPLKSQGIKLSLRHDGTTACGPRAAGLASRTRNGQKRKSATPGSPNLHSLFGRGPDPGRAMRTRWLERAAIGPVMFPRLSLCMASQTFVFHPTIPPQMNHHEGPPGWPVVASGCFFSTHRRGRAGLPSVVGVHPARVGVTPRWHNSDLYTNGMHSCYGLAAVPVLTYMWWLSR